MTSRTSSASVTFVRPFHLAGFDGDQPAGTYRVDTEEELIESLSFPAWRRTATTIHLSRKGATEFVPIDPVELAAALMRDGRLTVRPAETPDGDRPPATIDPAPGPR